MKVLHTLDSLNRGGAETLALDLCRNAGRFGIDLTFVATGGGQLEDQFENSGVDYCRLQREYPIDPNLVWELRKIIKRKEIEIVHGYQPVECMHLYLAVLGLKNVKCVYSHQGGGLFLAKRKNRIASRIFAPLMDANISCSQGLFPWLRDAVGLDTSKNFHLVYNGADPMRLQSTGPSIKEELGTDHNSLILGMVANFMSTNTKDQLTVCRALPKVFEEFENSYFVFVGGIAEGGEQYYDKCVKYCDDSGIGQRVFFLGTRDDVPNVLNSLDLFVFSTLHEGLPIALTEAMLAGIPVIASDIEPNLEATNNGECAEIFEAGNSGELAGKIIGLLKDDDLRRGYAKSAFAYSQTHFSIGAHLRSLKTLYMDLLDRKDTEERDIDAKNGSADENTQ